MIPIGPGQTVVFNEDGRKATEVNGRATCLRFNTRWLRLPPRLTSIRVTLMILIACRRWTHRGELDRRPLSPCRSHCRAIFSVSHCLAARGANSKCGVKISYCGSGISVLELLSPSMGLAML